MPRVVVIGGGAAGIAAARTLHDAEVDVLLIEAGDRLGGRARSVVLPAPDGGKYTVDLGCGWLHSAGRNPWVDIAKRHGFTVDRDDPHWRDQWRNLGYPPADQRAFAVTWKRWSDAAHAALGGADRPLSDFVAADDRWRPQLDAVSGYANGAPLEQVSLHDWAAYEDAATDDNWTVPAGFGTLVVRHADAVPVRLGTAASCVDRRGPLLRIDTQNGVIEAERVVVAVPTPVLAQEALAFDPPLPEKRVAAAALPLGVADKVFLYVDAPAWPADAHLIGDPSSACTASHRLSPWGLPIIESFFGGICAETWEGRDAAAFAVEELVRLLGSDWRRRLTPLRTTRWRQEAGIGGSYSHARIGCAPQRGVLAMPVEERLFFAGEACDAHDFSTAHGAYQTGARAARQVLASLVAPR